MKRNESIDVQIGISAGWKVVKGFCDEFNKKKKIKIKKRKRKREKILTANICNSIGLALGWDWGWGWGFFAWVGVMSSDEPSRQSLLSQLLLTTTTTARHGKTWIYMRMLKIYLKIAHTHRCTVVIRATRWQHSCALSRGTGTGTRAWPMQTPNRLIQPHWCPRNLHWSSLNTEFGIRNREYRMGNRE